MNIETHLQVWNALRPHLAGADIQAAAEEFINVLIEHGANASDMTEYALDKELKIALLDHTDNVDVDDDDDFYEDDEY